MKIQNTPIQLNTQIKNKENKQNQTSFKGGAGFVQLLNFLETNQAIGASFVDVGCMGIPRTLTDFSRGPEAGTETMRREFSSTIVDALIGVYGIGAAVLVSQKFNKTYDVKAQKMLINDDTLDIFSKTWEKGAANKITLTKNGGTEKVAEAQMESFLNLVIKNAKGFNTDLNKVDGWVDIDEKAQKEFVKKLMEEVHGGSDKLSKESKAYLKNLLADSTGAEKSFKLIGDGKEKSISSLDTFIDDLFQISKALSKKEVSATFKDAVQNVNGKTVENAFFKHLKGVNKKTAILGMAIATALGCSLQPINMYLTKKKTGKSGFVGVEGREPDNSKGFKIMKAAFAAAGALLITATIAKKPSDVLKEIKFKGFLPTIPQYKFVYGMTIVSRFLAARDKNELREASIKDSLGFVNWLILGGFVSKFTAAGLQKMDKFKTSPFIRYSETEHGKGFWKWLTKSPIVSREEVLHSAFKEMGLSTIKDGKALSFKQMLKELTKIIAEKGPKAEIAKLAKSKVGYLGLIQAAGYLYSGVVLGVGIPKLNIAITKSIEAKRKAKEEAAKKTAA